MNLLFSEDAGRKNPNPEDSPHIESNKEISQIPMPKVGNKRGLIGRILPDRTERYQKGFMSTLEGNARGKNKERMYFKENCSLHDPKNKAQRTLHDRQNTSQTFQL